MGHWASKKIVVRDFYISFKPMGADPNSGIIDLSDPIANQASDEAIYVAVTGRPAGFWNFIRELVGLSRRFEFVMSSSQCIQRLGSPTTQILSSSRIDGLNTITVGLVRPLVQAIILGLMALSLVVAVSYKPNLTGMEALSAAEAAAAADYENDSSYGGGGYYDSQTNEMSALQEFEEPSTFGMTLSLVNMVLLGIAPAWLWFLVALGLGLYAAYLFFIDKRNLLSVSESGDPVVGFIVSPSFLESKSTDIPLSELNKLPMIFRVLKDK